MSYILMTVLIYWYVIAIIGAVTCGALFYYSMPVLGLLTGAILAVFLLLRWLLKSINVQ